MVLRIKLRYPDVETFVEKFAVNVGRSGLFLTTRGLQPVATELRFELRLADDQVVLAGVGRVAAVYEPDDERPEAPYGMAIEFMRVTREGRDLVMRMLEHRRATGMGEPALPVPELDPDEIAALESAEARRSSGAIRLPRPPQAPPSLEAERPRTPRTRAIELVAHLAAQPANEAEREAARSEAVALDALLGRASTQDAGDSIDLARALERARAIAGAGAASGASGDAEAGDRFHAELAELAKPIAVAPAPREMAEGTRRGVSAAMRKPVREAREAMPAPVNDDAPAALPQAAAAPAVSAPPAAEPAQPRRQRFSAFTKREEDPLAEHTPPPGFAPQATPNALHPNALHPNALHQSGPRPGAPSTLAAAAQLRAEQEAAKAPSAAEPPNDADTTQPDPEPRRKRVGRPERLTRPPGVFARRTAEASTPPPVDAVVIDTPLDAALDAANHASIDAALAAPTDSPLADVRELGLEVTPPAAGRAMSEATFERVLAELEETDAPPPRRAAIAPAAHAAPAAAPYDPLDQLALDDLDDAEPAAGSPSGRRTPQPWYATIDETAPVEPIDMDARLDARLDSGLEPSLDPSLDDSGFEILAETELASHDLLEGTASAAPRYEEPPSHSPPPPAGSYDDPPREPITARSALAAAVSRPTWTRSKALDAVEPAAPVNELAPPTIPGRVPTREIDLESALDALDIEADAPVVPLQPRQPLDDDPPHTSKRGDSLGDDDFPIELEFDDQ